MSLLRWPKKSLTFSLRSTYYFHKTKLFGDNRKFNCTLCKQSMIFRLAIISAMDKCNYYIMHVIVPLKDKPPENYINNTHHLNASNLFLASFVKQGKSDFKLQLRSFIKSLIVVFNNRLRIYFLYVYLA